MKRTLLVGFCLTLLLISPAFSLVVRRHQFKIDEIYHPTPRNQVDKLNGTTRYRPGVHLSLQNHEEIMFSRLEGTLYSKSLSQLSEFERIRFAVSNLEQIEDGALCSSPFKQIAFNYNLHLPQLTRQMFGTCSSLDGFTFYGNLEEELEKTSPSFSHDTLSVLANLGYVIISRAGDWKYIPKTFLTGSTKLYDFKVYYSNITYVEKGAFDDLTDLENLVLEKNELERIDQGVLSKLTKLRSLRLADNKLESFPWDDLIHMPNLRSFDISNNQINMSEDDLKKVLKYLPKLSSFDFKGNAMTCEEMKERVRVLKEQKPDVYGGGIEC